MIGGRVGVGIAEADERSMLRTGNQPRARVGDDDAGAFGADERARHVESVFGEQLIEVVSGNAAGDIWKTTANQIRVLVADGAQLRVDLSTPSSLAHDAIEIA